MTASPIFIVGCPRSGTTLLRNLLRSHPRLTIPYETHFIPALYRGYGHPHTEREAVALATRILHLEWIRAWNLGLAPEEFAPDRSFQAVLCRLYGAWARRENKPRWGDKTPHYVMEIDTLVELFPAGKVIHIIRDGRDVALSWLKAGFEPRNLFTAATLWRKHVSAGISAGARLGPESYCEVRYEELVSREEQVMRRICAFVGEPFHGAVLHPSPLAPIMRPPLFGRREPAGPSKTEIVPPPPGRWKMLMTPADRLLFESLAGDRLAALGYETAGLTRRITAGERLAWTLHHRFWWVIHRLNTRASYRWLLTAMAIWRARGRGPARSTAAP